MENVFSCESTLKFIFYDKGVKIQTQTRKRRQSHTNY